MNILVTGGTGFIGRALVERLKPLAGDQVKLVYTSRHGDTSWNFGCLAYGLADTPVQHLHLDVTCPTQVAKLAMLFEPDVVFHLAANPLVRNTGPDLTTANVLGTHHLLEHAKPGSRFVFASSATVYGNLGRPGCWCVEQDKTVPTSVYAASKLASENLVTAYQRAGKIGSHLNVRMAAQVGKNTTHGLLHDIVRKLRSDSPTLDLLGDRPGSCKPYTHVEDTAAGLADFGLGAFNGTVNLTLDDNLTVEQVAHVAMSVLNIGKPIRWLGNAANWPGDNPYVLVANGTARHWGWKPAHQNSQAALAAAVQSIAEAS